MADREIHREPRRADERDEAFAVIGREPLVVPLVQASRAQRALRKTDPFGGPVLIGFLMDFTEKSQKPRFAAPQLRIFTTDLQFDF